MMSVVMNVVGARPQFIKAGPVSRSLAMAEITEILVHTGQHYDDLMSDAIMVDVGLREPDFNLGVGSGTHGAQTAQILEKLEALILAGRPDAVLIYGDTNSTVAAALASAKLGVLTVHVEAGLRSFNRTMPEELNRVVTDHLSDMLMAPTESAMDHLSREGLAGRSLLSGDVMVDALQSIDLAEVDTPVWAINDYYVATIHRPENTDDAERLTDVLDALGSLNAAVHLIAHPRLRQRIQDFGLNETSTGELAIHDPLPYSVMLKVVADSRGVLTDSGGLQKEAFVLGVPCVTLREETEWPETLVGDWNVLAGKQLGLLKSLAKRMPGATIDQPFGDGRAAARIVEEVTKRIS